MSFVSEIKTIMRKSPKLRAIQLTKTNMLKIIYTLRSMDLIHKEYRSESHSLFYGAELVAKIKVGEHIVAHPDKTISIISEKEYNTQYLHC